MRPCAFWKLCVDSVPSLGATPNSLILKATLSACGHESLVTAGYANRLPRLAEYLVAWGVIEAESPRTIASQEASCLAPGEVLKLIVPGQADESESSSSCLGRGWLLVSALALLMVWALVWAATMWLSPPAFETASEASEKGLGASQISQTC
jgi:hypothetical protein